MSSLRRQADTYEVFEQLLEALLAYLDEIGPKGRRRGGAGLPATERQRLLRRIKAILGLPEDDESEEGGPADGRTGAGGAETPKHPGGHEHEDQQIQVLREIRDRLGAQRG